MLYYAQIEAYIEQAKVLLRFSKMKASDGSMTPMSLEQISRQRPYPDFAEWWPMGQEFLTFMSVAIVGEWRKLGAHSAHDVDEDLKEDVEEYVGHYIDLVYATAALPSLVESFMQATELATIRSGEFDALSYGFYRSAFELLATRGLSDEQLDFERHEFCRRVGKRVYGALEIHLGFELPDGLRTANDFEQTRQAIDTIGGFLRQQGYLRDHFAFRFDVQAEHGGQVIDQTDTDFLQRITTGETGYALYEMGYPAILPSAVYLYHTMGEAQHHSSRIIEDFFGSIGYAASETDDFDPTGSPSDMVVELWEIRPAK